MIVPYCKNLAPKKGYRLYSGDGNGATTLLFLDNLNLSYSLCAPTILMTLGYNAAKTDCAAGDFM